MQTWRCRHSPSGESGAAKNDLGSNAQLGPKPIDVDAFVGKQGARGEGCDQWLDANAVGTLAAKKDEADQISQRVEQCDDVVCQAASESSDSPILSPSRRINVGRPGRRWNR